ncbi:hypothetical protein [Anaerococcus octavius]|uniref:hypothetical protein n=1 Tax=Anaerococcus octavius TaxID=54007 RepID=UPI0037350CB9
MDSFIEKKFSTNKIYHMDTDSVLTAFLTLEKNQWLLAPQSFIDLIPKNLDLEYFREDNFPDYKIYLVKYENNEWFRGVVDDMVEFYG